MTTGTNGQAQTTLILGSDAAGSYAITATSQGQSVSGTATVTTSPPPTIYSIHVISGPGSGAPGDTLTFVVEVRVDGTAIQGETVTFSITSGDGNASLGTQSATTSTNGQAQTTLILGSNASGSYAITATSQGQSVTGTATVTTSPPSTIYSIHVISGPGSGAPGDTLTFVVGVRADGAAGPNQTVDFSITSGDGNASLGTQSATTGTNGQAQTTLILGTNASGSYAITATSQGQSVSGTATVTTSPPPPPPPPPQYSIVVISGPGSGEPGDTLTFVVEVRENGAASSGQSVTFNITSGDGNASLGTQSVTTGTNGQAQTTLILGSDAAGSYAITATSQGQSVSGTATVTTSPPSTIYSIHVMSGPGSGAPGDTLTFVVEVRADGAASSGQSVTFSITSGDGNASLGAQSATTGTNGQAQTTLILGSDAAGSYAITATSQGQSVSGTATVTTGDGNGNGNGNGNNGGGNNGGNNQGLDIPQRSEPEPIATVFYEFELDLYAGWNFVHIPLEVTQVNGESMSIETVGNLFQVLMPAHMYIYDGDRWIEVFSDSEQVLSTNQGVAVYMNAPLTVSLVGLPLSPTFSLQRGLTFVGIPRQSSDLPKVSDFLTFYPKICVVFLASKGELYLVGRAGDSGDTKITGGQAFGIISLSQYLTGFYGKPWGTKQFK